MQKCKVIVAEFDSNALTALLIQNFSNNRVIQYMHLALDGDSLALVTNEYGRMRA